MTIQDAKNKIRSDFEAFDIFGLIDSEKLKIDSIDSKLSKLKKEIDNLLIEKEEINLKCQEVESIKLKISEEEDIQKLIEYKKVFEIYMDNFELDEDVLSEEEEKYGKLFF